MDLDAIRAHVEEAVRAILQEREGMPDIGMEPRPAERNRLAARRRMLGEYQAAIGGGHSIVLKVAARVEDCRGRRATSLSASDIMERRSASASSPSERDAWLLGAQWLRGVVGGSEVPGGVIAMSRELEADRLQPVPNIGAELETLQADLAQHVARLVAELDAWDRQRKVTADVTVDLPALQVTATAGVK